MGKLSFVLDLLSLRCLLDIQMEMLKYAGRYLDLNFREEVQTKDKNLVDIKI